MNKKICVFIGSRANYSSLRPIMKKIQQDTDLDLILFVGASAVLDKYGEVAELVQKDGFRIDERIYMLVEGENPTTMAKSTGLGLIEIAGLLDKHKPDFTLIIGDRHEMLAVAIASAFMNIPIAHTMGGEISGTIDESIRHAITKLAHVHFPANEEARKRIIKMGEKEEMVFNVGCPRMDAIKEILGENHDVEINSLTNKDGVGDIFDIDGNFILVSQHPVTTEFEQGEKQINETLEALLEVQKEKNVLIIMLWPNADAGSDSVSQGIRKFREKVKPSNFHFFKNLPLPIYVHLMNKTKCLIGNSSSGIRDGAFIGTPVVNIGTRQLGRSHGKNVIHVGHNKYEIAKAILKQMEHGIYNSESIYGDGNASTKIVEILKTAKPEIQKN